jgi:hypothetical protein
MITAKQIEEAYGSLAKAEETQYLTEEARIAATIKRDEAFGKAIDQAKANDIMDPQKQQVAAFKATSTLLKKQQAAEKASREAAHKYRQAAILADSLRSQLDAQKQYKE